MQLVIASIQLIIASLTMWFASGLIISGIERFSKNIRVSAFATSFFILGVLTSLTEISVGLNAVVTGKPGIFVGNLIGGAFVLITLVIPVLAIFNKGIKLDRHLEPKKMFFFLLLLIAPAIVSVDMVVTRYDAVFLLGLYALFVYIMEAGSATYSTKKPEHKSSPTFSIGKNFFKIVFGAVLIFLASRYLISTTLIFADVFNIQPFFVSLLMLSIGTNLPEIVIAVSSIRHKHSETAFGDYIGSAAANTLIFAVLTFIYGTFELNAAVFGIPLLIIMFGYVLFFIFSRSRRTITPYEGLVLLTVFMLFIFMQVSSLADNGGI